MARTITDTEAKKPSTVTAEGKQKRTVENRKSLKGDLDNILLLALRKEPARRYQSVEQFSDDIRRHLEARPVLARRDTVGYRASKFIRRNRALTAAAVLVVLSLVGGLVATSWQAQRAKAEKARAERRFNDVRQLAHSVLFDYHDAIKDLPGATRARERLVKDALVYLDRLASEAAGDSELQRELAAAYERVGDVRGQAYSANLGDRVGAQDSYLKSLQIRETLAASKPGDVTNRRHLAAIYRKLGNGMLDTTDAARGIDYLHKALLISFQLPNEEKENPELQHELAESYNDIGLALEDRGDMAGALENQRKALALREALVAKNANDITARRDLSVTYVNTGRALFFTGDIGGAIEINAKALNARKALLQQDPTNADYRRLVAIAYQNDGDYRAQTGDNEGALESFRKKLVLDEESLLADPANAQARSDYAYSSERLGVLSAAAGRYGEALEHFQKNVTLSERMVADDGQNVAAQYKATLAHAEMAMATAHAGTPNAALAEASATNDRLAHLPNDPANVYLRGLRARTYGFIGDAYATVANVTSAKVDKIARWRNARQLYELALATWNDLKTRGVLPADDATKPEELSAAIAKCDAASAAR
jgi:non-specific serine/threonine protein kinase/serine/threonine-protein kinase